MSGFMKAVPLCFGLTGERRLISSWWPCREIACSEGACCDWELDSEVDR